MSKKQVFEQLAMVAQSLSTPARIELLDYIAQAERSVEELSDLTDLTPANTSRHLQVLKQTGLVKVRKQGKQRIYQIAGGSVIKLLSSLGRTAEAHVAETERLLSEWLPEKDAFASLDCASLYQKSCQEDLTVLDVRPEKEYTQGHILGAVHIDPDEIDVYLSQANKNSTYVTYCRGPYCVYSYQMLKALKEKGLQAYRLEAGFPEWQAQGYPIETA